MQQCGRLHPLTTLSVASNWPAYRRPTPATGEPAGKLARRAGQGQGDDGGVVAAGGFFGEQRVRGVGVDRRRGGKAEEETKDARSAISG
jgi:hypothetical protein